MNWSDERYVRLYTRDTADWMALSFDAQALLSLLLRKADRSGVIACGKHGKRAAAIVIGHAREWSRLEPALEELLADGVLDFDGESLIFPNFVEAQRHLSERLRLRDWIRAKRESAGFIGVFERDKHRCRYCGVAGSGLSLDHVVPQSRGGANEPWNLVTACGSCNSRKGARTPEEAGMALLPVPAPEAA